MLIIMNYAVSIPRIRTLKWDDGKGIFLENSFKYKNAHNDEFGGAICTKYVFFLRYFMLTNRLFHSRNSPLVIASMNPFKF